MKFTNAFVIGTCLIVLSFLSMGTTLTLAYLYYETYATLANAFTLAAGILFAAGCVSIAIGIWRSLRKRRMLRNR